MQKIAYKLAMYCALIEPSDVTLQRLVLAKSKKSPMCGYCGGTMDKHVPGCRNGGK